MAEQLKTKKAHKGLMIGLSIGLIVSFIVALVIYLALWTKVINVRWTRQSSISAMIGMCVAILCFCVAGVWLVLELTRNKAWARKAVVTVRTVLVGLLLVCYAGVGFLMWQHMDAQLIHSDNVHLTDFDEGTMHGSFDYIYNKQGEKIVGQDGKPVKIYIYSEDYRIGKKYALVDNEYGRIVGHNEQDPIFEEAEKQPMWEPFEPAK